MNKPSPLKEELLADLRQLRQQPGWVHFQAEVQSQLASAQATALASKSWEEFVKLRARYAALAWVVAWWDNLYHETLTTPSAEFGATEDQHG